MLVEKDGGIIFTYTRQMTVDYLVVVQVIEAAGDANQLHSSKRRVRSPKC